MKKLGTTSEIFILDDKKNMVLWREIMPGAIIELSPNERVLYTNSSQRWVPRGYEFYLAQLLDQTAAGLGC